MKEKIKTILIIILLVVLIFSIFYYFNSQQKMPTVEPDAFYIEKYFLSSELYCPEDEQGAGRLNKQCYLLVPCYKSGGRLSNITCDEGMGIIPPPKR